MFAGEVTLHLQCVTIGSTYLFYSDVVQSSINSSDAGNTDTNFCVTVQKRKGSITCENTSADPHHLLVA